MPLLARLRLGPTFSLDIGFAPERYNGPRAQGLFGKHKQCGAQARSRITPFALASSAIAPRRASRRRKSMKALSFAGI